MNTPSNVRYDYRGAHVLVTGGTQGIGAGIAAAYRQAGAHVTITGTRSSAREYEADLSAYDYLQLDLSDNGRIEAVAADMPVLDVLVNNAGGNFAVQNEYDPDIFDKAVQVNLLSAYRMAHACHRKLAASRLPGGASIIGLASMTSYFAVEAVPGYGAAKAGLVQLTKTLATAWARDGIRVNAVAAGFIRSSMMSWMDAGPQAVAPILARTPLRRVGEAADIADVVLFLTSAAARFVTGQTLPVDGGYSVVG